MKNRIFEGLEPSKVFYWFEEICRIPHGSGNEKAISDYIAAAARDRGFNVIQDPSRNLVVDLPATKGLENRKKIILQGHIDMVCQKAEGVEFDFLTQPIRPYIDGEYIKARGTTLGADDGFAVAMLLAIMDSPELPHAPLQMVFTTEEEVFLVGAHALDGNLLDGDYLIGLDCSRDDILMVSCSGISITDFVLDAKREARSFAGKQVIRLDITGLAGGHSGNMIHLGRANALKLTGELLTELGKHYSFDLLEISGGTASNNIPAQAYAVISCEAGDTEKLEGRLEELAQSVQAAYYRTDGGIQVSVTHPDAAQYQSVIPKENAKRLIRLLDLVYAGAYSIMDEKFSRAESSCNPAILTEKEGIIRLRVSIRSNSEYFHDVLLRKLQLTGELLGIKCVLEDRKMSWEYRPDSFLREQMRKLYLELNGEEPEIVKIHATVEASEFVAKMKNRGRKLDIVNIGCNNLDVHTPRERLEIRSVGKTWKLLSRIISELD